MYGELNDALLRKIAQGNAPTFTQLDEFELLGCQLAEDMAQSRGVGGGGGSSGVGEDEDRRDENGGDSVHSSPARGSSGRHSPNKHATGGYGTSAAGAAAPVGVAEAVLFGHMAEVLCSSHTLLSTMLQRHEGLLRFFQYICTTYFSAPYNSVTDGGSSGGRSGYFPPLHWKVTSSVSFVNYSILIVLKSFVSANVYYC